MEYQLLKLTQLCVYVGVIECRPTLSDRYVRVTDVVWLKAWRWASGYGQCVNAHQTVGENMQWDEHECAWQYTWLHDGMSVSDSTRSCIMG